VEGHAAPPIRLETIRPATRRASLPCAPVDVGAHGDAARLACRCALAERAAHNAHPPRALEFAKFLISDDDVDQRAALDGVVMANDAGRVADRKLEFRDDAGLPRCVLPLVCVRAIEIGLWPPGVLRF